VRRAASAAEVGDGRLRILRPSHAIGS
jgi:hypothetical protein